MFGKALALAGIFLATLLLGYPVQSAYAFGPGAVEEERHPIYVIRHLGSEGDVDRYEIVIRPGATLFDIAVETLPMLAPKDAVVVLQEAYKTAHPERDPNRIAIGDTFAFQVPLSTFVARTAQHKPNLDEYVSFGGDHLTWYPVDHPIRYRLVKAVDPDKVFVAVNPEARSAPDALARLVWGWDLPNFQPDYLQVRSMAGLFQGRNGAGVDSVIVVDLHERFLDPLRNYQDRATSVEDDPDGGKIYNFDPADPDVPFLRVEDRVNSGSDLASLPPGLLRVTYLRAGQIVQIRMTGFGEFLRVVNRPQQREWADLYSRWAPYITTVPKSWADGRPADVPAYPSAKRRNSYFTLESNRLLVLTFDPKPPPQELVCLGRPLLILSAVLLGVVVWRRQNGRWLP